MTPSTATVLAELARVKAIFQQRAILAVLGVNADTLRPISDTQEHSFEDHDEKHG